MEALFRVYFTEGRDISLHQTLIDVVAEAGVERQLSETTLNSDAGMDALKEAGALSRRHRIDGVPFFTINNEITLAGEQPLNALLDAFRQAVSPGSK